MSRLAKLLPLAVLLLLAAGCDSQDSGSTDDGACTDEIDASVLRPLTVGNYWIYEELQFLEVRDSLRHEVTARIEDASFPGGEGYVIRRSLLSDPSVYDERIWANGPDGHSMVGLINGEDTLRVDFLTYPYPASTGETFQAYTWAYPAGNPEQPFVTDSTRYEVLATSERFQTGVGSFNTTVFKYLLDGGSSGNYYFKYFLPGVGLVGQHRFPVLNEDRSGTPTFTQRLVELCLK
jgi:hypothetical protein